MKKADTVLWMDMKFKKTRELLKEEITKDIWKWCSRVLFTLVKAGVGTWKSCLLRELPRKSNQPLAVIAIGSRALPQARASTSFKKLRIGRDTLIHCRAFQSYGIAERTTVEDLTTPHWRLHIPTTFHDRHLTPKLSCIQFRRSPGASCV